MSALKVGDLVRVPARSKTGWHAFRQGSVCEVLSLQGTTLATLRGVSESYGATLSQLVPIAQLKLAKQAMNARQRYSDRRG